MSLDLGTLMGHVDLDVAKFERKYADVTSLVTRLASTTIPDLEVGADIRDATTSIDQVETALRRVGSALVTAEVDAAIDDARENLARIEGELSELEHADPSIDVTADIARAQAELGSARAELRALDGARAELLVEADTSGATAALDDVEAEATDAGGRAGKGAGAGLAGGVIAALATIPVAGAIVGIGAAIGEALLDGLDNEVREDKFAAMTGLDAATTTRMGRAAGEAYASNFGESIEGNLDTARIAIQAGLLDPNATKQDAQQVIQSLSGVASVLEEDVGATARAVGVMMRTGIAKDSQAAFDVLVRGAQTGANASEDLLDTFVEYPALFAKLGLTGEESLGLINQGLAHGARNADLVADALKEFQIRATDGSKASAEGYKIIGLNAEEMTAKIAAGGTGAKEGLDQVIDALAMMADPVARNAAGVALFGTQWEDLGNAFLNLDVTSAVEELGQVEGAAASALDTLGDNSAGKIASAQRNIELAADGIKGALATAFSPQIEGFATFVSTNREAVLTFLLGAANGGIDFGRAVVEGAAAATEGVGDFLGGPAADLLDVLADIVLGVDAATPGDQGGKGFRAWADEAIAGLKETDESLEGVADTMRTNLIENALDPAQAKLGELAIPMLAEAALNDATGRLATGVETLGVAADGSKLSLSELNGVVDLSTAAGQELDGQIRSVIGALDAQLVSASRAGEGQEQLRGRVESARTAFIDQMTALGLTRDAASRLADQYGLIPDRVSTVVTADTSQADAAIAGFRARASAQAVVIQARVDADPNYSPAFSQNSIRRSKGGWIPGAPSAVDSVPAYLAPGEFVVNTVAAQKNPELVEAINEDKLGNFLGAGLGTVPAPRAQVGTQPAAVPSVAAGPVRLARADLDYLADRLSAGVLAGARQVSVGVVNARDRSDSGTRQTRGWS
ncbi:phage tail tape measure protein [Oerskovia jenensis]|uniref:phage tail tape measure protein n=1 Tax=Oerskovia jenensis TaxID=162169 RepID=UPI0036D77DA8